MKTAMICSAMGALAACSGFAHAEEFGRVVNATPVVQQVAVPRQYCNVQQGQPSAGGGAVVGAIVGGLLGNTIGHGMGRAAATGAGVIAGAAVGNNVENNGSRGYQQCSTQTSYENRTVAYNVTYEYGGQQYTVQMPNDPGPTIRLQMTPVGASNRAPSTTTYTTVDAGSYAAMPVEVSPVAVPTASVGYPVYPVYSQPYPYYAPYGYGYGYAPVGVSIGLGYYGGGGHYGHGGYHHWR